MKTMHGVSWSGGWGWVAHYVGREDGGAASDSDREMAMYVYTWVSRTLEELLFSFSFFAAATTSTGESGVAHYGISSQPNVACWTSIFGTTMNTIKRQIGCKKHIYKAR